MFRIKRSQYVFISFEDQSTFDIAAFLRGELQLRTTSKPAAYSLLTQSSSFLEPHDLELLARVSEKWTPVSQLVDHDTAAFDALVGLMAKGLVLSDSEDPEHACLRAREERLGEQQWHRCAAFYHFLTRGPDAEADQPQPLVDIRELALLAAENAAKFVDLFGPPPEAFHHRHTDTTYELPVIERDNALYQALNRRKTTRTFDQSRPMTVEQLATLLFYVFGCHGYTRFSPEVICLRKTSPSGGSLHPIEAYPLVMNVAGLETGFYHYDVERHALELVEQLPRSAAEDLAVQMAAGQAFAGTAHVITVMTARFHRTFWKYRDRSRAYGVILKDAGHLSQTLYLVAADLDLAAFYTGTISGPRIERALGIDGLAEGAIGICGCGLKPAGEESLALERMPFEPRKTQL